MRLDTISSLIFFISSMIILKNLTKSTNEKTLFNDLSLTINPGDRVGIIGPNGCGKSTLLKILAGFDTADSGVVDKGREQILFAPQHIDAAHDATIDDYLNPSDYPDVWRLLSELNLIDIPLDTPISQLSGGQKTKLILIKIFSTPSTTLLLDEPTNHLDTETRQWLIKEMMSYQGIVITVSHDRAFLNTCATTILEIDPANHQVIIVHGNYDLLKKEKAARLERQKENYDLQQRKRKDMLEWMALKRQEATVHPSPAKGRQLRQMEHRFEREITAIEIPKPKIEKTMTRTGFSGDVHTGKIMLRLSKVDKKLNDTPILHGVSFELRGKVHARLTGENGSGKSTLLRIITGNIIADSGKIEIGENVKIGYFAQQLETLDENKSIIETFTSIAGHPLSEQRARTILGAFLFSGENISKKIRNTSHGERVRLQLAMLLQQEYQLLILDEPTNHLDIPSREIVEDALREYQGALLIVSHDEYFLHRIGIDIEIPLSKNR